MPQSLQTLYDDLWSAHRWGKRGKEAAGSSDDMFIVQLIELVVSYGIQIRASDIHLEPVSSGMRVRYRIDGMLQEMLQLPADTRDLLTRAIKVRVGLATDIVIRSKPQDGRIDFEIDGGRYDLRLSSFPTLYGDLLTMRILDRTATLLPLEQLGFPPGILREFEQLIRRPNGLLLVAGPANSGKTTVLYAVLNKLNSPHVKIITLEDPVEYQMDGIDQGQINTAVGLTFAEGLRAILRQDSNVILVGEIRDRETAEIGIRAALTGHLVLSTLHTRNSAGAVTRLLDMEVEPHLLVASINGVLAQRLVRLVCPDCKRPDPDSARMLIQLWKQESGAEPSSDVVMNVSKGAGCAACNSTGYRGRTGIYELLVVKDELRELTLQRASGQLHNAAVSAGMKTMVFNGLEKAAAGLTTVEEVLRVIGESETV